MEHLTDKQLIDLAFDLTEDALRSEQAEHLALCSDCQQRQAALQRRLTGLDQLAAEEIVGEALLTETLNAVQPKPLHRLLPWWASVAALLLVGLFIAGLWQQAEPSAVETEEEKMVATDVSPSVAPLLPIALDHSRIKRETPSIPDRSQPPFAPASAIELVILPKREQVQLTIYNAADLTLVREQRHCVLKRGWNWLQFMWAETKIDPTSLELTPLEQTEQIHIEQLSFPPRLGQLGRWLLWSDVEGAAPFEITYLTSGLSWQAFYQGTLNREHTKMDLDGFVKVTNQSGEDYENAEVRLVVGEVQLLDEIATLVGRIAPYDSPLIERENLGFKAGREVSSTTWAEEMSYGWGGGSMGGMRGGMGGMMLKPKEILKQAISEYQLYRIEGTETIPHGWSRRLRSVEVEDVNVSYLYKYSGFSYGHGGDVFRYLNFFNNEDHSLGEQPLPEGPMTLYRVVDPDNHLAYDGVAEMPYIPIGQEIELILGLARHVTVVSRLMDFRQEQFRFHPLSGDVQVWDEVRSMQVAIANHQDVPITVEVSQPLWADDWTIEVDKSRWGYEEISFEEIRFTTRVEPGTESILPYTLRTHHED